MEGVSDAYKEYRREYHRNWMRRRRALDKCRPLDGKAEAEATEKHKQMRLFMLALSVALS